MPTMVGARVLRKEDPNLLTGSGTFVDDVQLTGTLHVGFARSTEAHAEIVSIDTSEAAALDGVVGVYTIDDFADYGRVPGVPGMDRPVLAQDRVRFVGEPVAIVVAESAYIAADAAELIYVEYNTLPAVMTPAAAMADGAPVLHEAIGSNVLLDTPFADDLAEVFDSAPRTAVLDLHNNRVHPVPMETSVVLADWGRDKLTVWASTQVPHALRTTLSNYLGVSQSHCRVIQPDVGGGFGAKVQWYPELLMVPILSKWHNRPVKYVQTRSESFVMMVSGRDQWHHAEVAFDDEGNILGLRSMVIGDVGGYPDVPTALGMPTLTNWMASGCYSIPAIAAGHKVVATNKSQMSSYRGAGRPEATFMIERVLDLVADETGIDPAEVRMRNFIPADAFPYKTPHAEVYYDSGDYAATLEVALELCDYEGLKAQRDARNADPSQKLMGIGLSTWCEIAAFGPRGALEGFGHIGSYETAQVKIQPDGTAIISTGAAPHGQGTVTTLAQIAADNLQMDIDKITVRYGDTDTVPQGVGTMGSRITAIAGQATQQASIKVADQAKRIAAHKLEADVDDIELADGNFFVAGTPSVSVSWAEVGWAGLSPTELPEDMQAGCLDELVFAEATGFTFPNGAYICVVGVDRDTGAVEIEQFHLVDDCGTVINPLLAEGQVEGGVAQGIAQALFEEMVYSDEGQLLTSTLLDYLAPSACDVPEMTSLGRTTTVTPHNTLGAKGIGESGAIGSPPAVINAVVDALSGFGVKHVDMPATPQKVWNLMNNGQEG
jgi:aerobic carbon-monoxide dehydrogenase large subunit